MSTWWCRLCVDVNLHPLVAHKLQIIWTLDFCNKASGWNIFILKFDYNSSSGLFFFVRAPARLGAWTRLGLHWVPRRSDCFLCNPVERRTPQTSTHLNVKNRSPQNVNEFFFVPCCTPPISKWAKQFLLQNLYSVSVAVKLQCVSCSVVNKRMD